MLGAAESLAALAAQAVLRTGAGRVVVLAATEAQRASAAEALTVRQGRPQLPEQNRPKFNEGGIESATSVYGTIR